MAVKIFVTGGTFDKDKNELDGRLFFKDTHLPENVETRGCKVPVEIRTLMLVDSLEMTDADRQLIIDQCKKAKEARIVITHGTDTMEVTAQVLGKAVINKTIVLTGAMVPVQIRQLPMDCSISAARSRMLKHYPLVCTLQ